MAMKRWQTNQQFPKSSVMVSCNDLHFHLWHSFSWTISTSLSYNTRHTEQNRRELSALHLPTWHTWTENCTRKWIGFKIATEHGECSDINLCHLSLFFDLCTCHLMLLNAQLPHALFTPVGQSGWFDLTPHVTLWAQLGPARPGPAPPPAPPTKATNSVEAFKTATVCTMFRLIHFHPSLLYIHKYLGTVLDNKLNFNKNTDFVHKRCQPRLFCFQKLRSLTYFRPELYWISFNMCWFGGVTVKSKSVLNKVVNVCGKVVGERQEQLSQLYECRVAWKAMVIVNDNSHVLDEHYELLPSGRWFHVPKSNTNQ